MASVYTVGITSALGSCCVQVHGQRGDEENGACKSEEWQLRTQVRVQVGMPVVGVGESHSDYKTCQLCFSYSNDEFCIQILYDQNIIIFKTILLLLLQHDTHTSHELQIPEESMQSRGISAGLAWHTDAGSTSDASRAEKDSSRHR